MFTEDQYYFRVDNEVKPVALFRMRPPFLAEQWFEGKWQKSDQLLVCLRDGFVDLDRCSIEDARAFKPEAFEFEEDAGFATIPAESTKLVSVKPFVLKDHGMVYEVLPYIFIPEQFIQASLFEPVRQAYLMFIRNPVIDFTSPGHLQQEFVGKETLYAAIDLLKESIGHGLFVNPNQGYVFEPVIDLPPLIAHAVHLYQVDKLGVPYIDHPKNVARNTEHSIGANPSAYTGQQIDTAIAAAWLHDVIEDSAEFFYREVTASDLHDWGINDETLEIVTLMTRTAEVQSHDYYLRLLKHPLARMVKLADVAHNTNVIRVSALDPAKRSMLRQKYDAALQALQFEPEIESWFQSRVENLDQSDCPFTSEESAQAFTVATSGEPLPQRFNGVLGESEMSALNYSVKDLLVKKSFTEEDSDLQLVAALLLQFYRLEYSGQSNYNSALVAEFYARKAKALAAGVPANQNSVYSLQDLTISEVIRRAKRAVKLLEKYNFLALSDDEQFSYQEDILWPDDHELSRDEAAELLLVAFFEMDDFEGRRVEILDIKRIIINCLELLKFRVRAIYKFAAYSSQEEYETTAESEAEIFGCLANSEQEAYDIAEGKGYWSVNLIEVRPLTETDST